MYFPERRQKCFYTRNRSCVGSRAKL